ncbi:MAG: hypothetical protein WCK84_14020 [Bacteroidota bacterium]
MGGRDYQIIGTRDTGRVTAEDIMEFLELQKAERSGVQQRRVSVDFPAWMVREFIDGLRNRIINLIILRWELLSQYSNNRKP